jgi:hypothetical protein
MAECANRWGIVLLALWIVVGAAVEARAYVLEFDELSDLDPLTDQYHAAFGVDFSAATVLSAGVSLNEFEFPPRSGANVIFDDGGPMLVTFDVLALEAGGYFTYSEPITLTAYDASFNVLGTIGSSHSSNLALSGDPGSSPNELVQISIAGGFVHLGIAGDALGGSFVLDDFTATPVPEPALSILAASGLVLIGALRRVSGKKP